MNHFMSSEIENTPANKARFSVLAVPFEESVSYGGGTKQGPEAIIRASDQLEVWDGYSKPSEHGIHTAEAIDCSGSPEEVVNRIAAKTQALLEAGSMPVVLGGEHTVTYGVVKGYLAAGFRDFGVVQIDAHADLRDAYEDNPYSHASVMKRVVDEGIPLYQLGIRAYCEEEKNTRESNPKIYFQDADELVPKLINQITLPDDFPKQVFFTVDVDGLDPSVFPSTGTPVPGGLLWHQSLGLFESVANQREIIGFDIMEFAPIKGFHAYDFSAALLTHKLMGITARSLDNKA